VKNYLNPPSHQQSGSLGLKNLKDGRKNTFKSSNNWQNQIQNFDPQAAAEWATQTFQKRGIAFYGTGATILLSTYFIADLTALVVGSFIPEAPLNRNRGGGYYRVSKTLEDYSIIFSRNLFNSRGIIPGDENLNGTQDIGGPPVRTTLPLNLIGTLVLSNELLSIATIEDKATSSVYPVRIEDEIPNKLKILKIEPNKVIFLNTSSNRREFIDIPEDAAFKSPVVNLGRPSGSQGIEKVSPSQFNVARSEVDKAMADFNNILTQARAVPNFENGVPAGYKLFQIVPGSIYDKLGLQNGDVIMGLNGQPINDPGKAFEMLNELKTASHLELQVKKDGKQSTYSYDIR
jgi:general secretion pathway protein C